MHGLDHRAVVVFRGRLTIATALLINEQFLEPKLLGERVCLGACARQIWEGSGMARGRECWEWECEVALLSEVPHHVDNNNR